MSPPCPPRVPPVCPLCPLACGRTSKPGAGRAAPLQTLIDANCSRLMAGLAHTQMGAH